MRVASLLLASTALALTAALPADAQERQTEATRVDDVVVTGSQVTVSPAYAGGQVATGGRVGLFGGLDVMDTPFSTANYTETLARDQQARSVGDVLQNDPVVRVTKGFGNFQELYVVRGFPVYSDDMTYNGLYGVLPRQFTAAELLERVEAFRGATAFLNGAAPGGSGVGGAFNLVPKRAAGDLNRLTLGVEGGGELYGAADVARRFGSDRDWGVRLNLVRRDGESAIDRQARTLDVIGLGIDRRGGRARFSADLGFQDHRIDAPRPTVTPAGDVPTPPDAAGNFAQPWTFTDERQLFGAARGELDLAPNVTAWAAIGGRDGREANVLANPTAQPDGGLTAYRFDNAREDVVWSGDVGVRADVTFAGTQHRLVASAASVTSKSRNAYAFSSFFTPFASDLHAPIDVAPPAATFFVGGDLDAPRVTERVRNGSFAVADMATLMDGRLILTAGARFQDIRTRTYDYGTGALGSAYDGDAVTPAFAVVYKPKTWLSLYANYAEGLVPGQIAPATSGGSPVSNAGEVLSPFRAEQGEVGFKYDVGRFGGTVSLFSTTLPSAFVQGGVFAVNGEQRNRGLEVTWFGEPRDGLRILGGWTLIDAQLRRTAGGVLDGRSAIGVPEFQANVNLEWDLPMIDGVTVEGRVVHTGSQPVDAANTVELEDWTRLDAGARWAFQAAGRPLTLRARVENLADEDHWVAVGGFPGANYLTLGAPRTVTVSLAAEF